MAAGNVGTVRPEDERLGIGASVAYGLQLVLTMYGGIIAVPLVMGGPPAWTRRRRGCSSPPASS